MIAGFAGALTAACSVFVVKWRPFRVEVRGDSMSPALHAGEWAVAVRGPARRGAVVVVEHPTRPGFDMVKRLRGFPGDSVGGRILDADEWWVEGANEGASIDSRTLGPVPRAAIKGRVVAVYAPLRRARLMRLR